MICITTFICIFTAPLLFSNITTTSIHNNATNTITSTSNISYNYSQPSHHNLLNHFSYYCSFTYSIIKRRLLIEAGTETNPGPISYTTISLLHPVPQIKEDQKCVMIYCKDGFIEANLLSILNFSPTLKESFFLSCTCTIISLCCPSIVLPEYEVQTLLSLTTLLEEGSVNVLSPGTRFKVLQCLNDISCNVNIRSTDSEAMLPAITSYSVSLPPSADISEISIGLTTVDVNKPPPSPSHLAATSVLDLTSNAPLPEEQEHYCRYNCGFLAVTKNVLKEHYKWRTYQESREHNLLKSQLQPIPN